MSRSHHLLRSLCMSLYTQSQRPLNFNTSTKTLTGFGPASSAERYLKGLDNKVSRGAAFHSRHSDAAVRRALW